MRDYVDLDAVVAFCRRLGVAVTWKIPDAVYLAWSGCLHHIAFKQWSLPRPRGAVAAAYTHCGV